MAVFQRPVSAHIAPAYHPAPRPYVRPAYVPPPRTITRYVPGPERVVTRNFYNTTYVNRGWSPAERNAFQESARQREFDRLMREGRWSREQAAAQAAALAAQQAAAQAAQIASQAATANAQAQSAAGLPPAPSVPNPQAAVSPGSATADLGPAQDQAAAAADSGGGGGDDSVSAKPHHLLLIGGIVVAAGVVGYMVIKKKTRAKSAD
jgi:hypothetical protein